MGVLWVSLGLIGARCKRDLRALKGQLRFRCAALEGRALRATRNALGKPTEVAVHMT